MKTLTDLKDSAQIIYSTPSEIKFNTIKLINGIKYMTKNQVEDCKAYVLHLLKLENVDENNNAIEEAIKMYFDQPV